MLKKVALSVLMLSAICAAQVLQQLKKTVVFICGQSHIRGSDGNTLPVEGALGTGFFVYYSDPRGGENYGFDYLVTAKHVLKDEVQGKFLKKINVRMNSKDGSGVGFETLEVSDSEGHLEWFSDKDDPDADVAVFLDPVPTQLADYLTFPVSSFSSDASLRESRVAEGDAVYLVGLLPQFTGKNRNYPVIRHGYIALLSDEPISLGPNVKERVYALELGSWPGQSGSPVFLSLGGYRNGSMMLGESYSLLGVMLGYFQNAIPLEVNPTESVTIGDSSNVGISFVLPASEILKVLNSREAQQERDKIFDNDIKTGKIRPAGNKR